LQAFHLVEETDGVERLGDGTQIHPLQLLRLVGKACGFLIQSLPLQGHRQFAIRPHRSLILVQTQSSTFSLSIIPTPLARLSFIP